MDKEYVKPKELSDIPGVGPATVEKLIESGFTDIMSVATATPKELEAAAGITDATAKKIIAVARAACEMGFESGIDVLKKREKIVKITTGCKAFDDLLGGGFETGAITECFGEYGSGKTQIGHLLAVHVQKLDPTAVAIYIDTENTFRPERIKEFAKGAKLDADKVLKNIKVAKAFNSDHQVLLLEKVESLIKEQKMNVKLVIVDSLTAHFRAEFIGRGTLADRQQKINRHMREMAKLAQVHNLCVYVTNQVMSQPDVFFGDPTKAIGGHIVAHASTYRIYLRRGKKNSRVAKLVDSPNLPEGEVNFMVLQEGIEEVK